MLVLARRTDESIIIGDDIVIKIVEVKGDMVRLGIEAPKSVRIYRTEIYEEIKKQNAQAALASKDAMERLLGVMKKE